MIVGSEILNGILVFLPMIFLEMTLATDVPLIASAGLALVDIIFAPEKIAIAVAISSLPK
jgi:hypothetical protein